MGAVLLGLQFINYMGSYCCRSVSMKRLKQSDIVKKSMQFIMNERDNKVIKDSMHDVPESLIPDRYKLILVPQ